MTKQLPPSFTVKLVKNDNNPPGEQLTFGRTKEIFTYLMGDLPHEEVHIIMLDPASSIIGTVRIAQGGAGMADVSPRDILRPAIAGNAHGVIVGHNHPQGVAAPSEDDLQFTEVMGNALGLADIQLVDHVIVNDQGESYSMKDEGDIEDE